MAATTVTGAIGGTPITFLASTSLQQILAQQILASATGTTAALVTGSGGFLTSSTTIDISTTGSVLSGNASVPSATVLLDGQNGSYVTGGTTLSTVVAADNSNSSITNSNPNGGLIAVTGAGGNVLNGAAGANQFITGTGGNDFVFLDGVSNSLTSNGSDAVLVGGPSTVTAAAGGADNIFMTSSTTLAFINGSKAPTVDSVTGAAGGTITLAGTGSTSVTSGAGPETFFVDTSAGNVTLNGLSQTSDTFEFIKDANTSTGAVTVNNFATGDSVNVHGYAGYNVTASATNPAGSVLVLSDGSQVTFSNVSVAALQQTVKVV